MMKFNKTGFTLVELLGVITILAALSVMIVFFTASYLNYAKKMANAETLAALNYAVQVYKSMGGLKQAHSLQNVTSTAKIDNVISALKNGFTVGGARRIFINPATTVNTAEIFTSGNGSGFYFSQSGTTAETMASSTGSIPATVASTVYKTYAQASYPSFWTVGVNSGSIDELTGRFVLYQSDGTNHHIIFFDANYNITSYLDLPQAIGTFQRLIATKSSTYRYILMKDSPVTTTILNSSLQVVSTGALGWLNSTFAFYNDKIYTPMNSEYIVYDPMTYAGAYCPTGVSSVWPCKMDTDGSVLIHYGGTKPLQIINATTNTASAAFDFPVGFTGVTSTNPVAYANGHAIVPDSTGNKWYVMSLSRGFRYNFSATIPGWFLWSDGSYLYKMNPMAYGNAYIYRVKLPVSL